MSEVDTKFVGGVELKGNYVRESKKLDNGKYQVTFNDGTVLTFKEQNRTASSYPSIYCSAADGNKDKPAIEIYNIDGAELTASNSSSSEFGIIGGKDNKIDVSQNNKSNNVFIAASENIQVKTDSHDKIEARVKFKETDKFKSFFVENKAGTHIFEIGDSFIKRANVPKSLLGQYDEIAHKNNNIYLDTEDEIAAFSKVVQTAFQKQEITQKDVEKMDFTVMDPQTSKFSNTEGGALMGGEIGVVIGLGIPIVSHITGGVGAIIGGLIGATVDAYNLASDKFNGIKDPRILYHWGE